MRRTRCAVGVDTTMTSTRKCSYCLKVKPRTREFFYYQQPGLYGKLYYQSTCIACALVRSREYYKKHNGAHTKM